MFLLNLRFFGASPRNDIVQAICFRRGAGLRRRLLPKAEAPTEPTGETDIIRPSKDIRSKNDSKPKALSNRRGHLDFIILSRLLFRYIQP